MRPRRPQPATVVALIALVVALSGTSIASVGGGSGRPDRACPPSTIAAAGLCFDGSPSGPVRGVKAAADACAAVGGYLPDPGQLARAGGALNLGRERRGLFSDSFRIVEGGRTALTTVVDASGRRSVIDEDLETGEPLASYRYACVYPPG
jgi:hypothetical protein